MKISDLKQPYRRMAEYLAERNINPRRNDKTFFLDAFDWDITNDLFWDDIYNGNYPEITEEIKTHFPADFDFSGEEEELSLGFAYKDSDLSDEFKESFNAMSAYARDIFYKAKKIVEDKEHYTQLAKEGKFDDLPDTCEFSEAVDLEVWDGVMKKLLKLISGKYKGLYMDLEFQAWDYAQLPTPKIDFSEFKTGDVVEVKTKENNFFIGYFLNENKITLDISYVKNERKGLLAILKENIKTITKIK